jgi:hypothetical protein
MGRASSQVVAGLVYQSWRSSAEAILQKKRRVRQSRSVLSAEWANLHNDSDVCSGTDGPDRIARVWFREEEKLQTWGRLPPYPRWEDKDRCADERDLSGAKPPERRRTRRSRRILPGFGDILSCRDSLTSGLGPSTTASTPSLRRDALFGGFESEHVLRTCSGNFIFAPSIVAESKRSFQIRLDCPRRNRGSGAGVSVLPVL